MARKLVIFDCDGTLVDTAADVAVCFDKALASCGFEPRGLEAVKKLLGRPLEVIIAGLLPEDAASDEDAVARVAQEYRKVFVASDKPNTKPFPGVPDVCRALIADGMTVAVNTNKPHENAVRTVGDMFPGIPMEVAGYGLTPAPKPAPDGIRYLMEHAGVTTAETVYVGDTIIDVNTASAAGVDCVLVTWGTGTPDLCEDERIMAVANTADELLQILETA